MSVGIQIAQIQQQSKHAIFERLAALKSPTTKEKETDRLTESNDRKNEKVLNLPDFTKVQDEEDVLILIDYLNSRDGRINIDKNNHLNKFDAYA